MYVVIDRFEGNYAICENDNREMLNLDKSKIPPEAKEGDVLILGDTIRIDLYATKKRKSQIAELTKDLWD